MSKIMREKRYSVSEFAAIVGRSTPTVYWWLRSGLIERRVYRPIPTHRPVCYFTDEDVAIAHDIIAYSEVRKRSGETRCRRNQAQPIVRSILAQWVIKGDRALLRAIAHAVTQATDGEITLSIEDVQAILKREKWDVAEVASTAAAEITDLVDRVDRLEESTTPA